MWSILGREKINRTTAFLIFAPIKDMILHVLTSGYSADSQLILIGVRTHTNEHKFWNTVEGFLDYFLSTDDKIVVGFNILKFDIPFLLLNTPSERLADFFKKINYSNIVDLFTVLTFQNKGIIKGLDYHLEKEGLSRDFPGDDEMRIKGEGVQESLGKKLEAIHSLYWRLRER